MFQVHRNISFNRFVLNTFSGSHEPSIFDRPHVSVVTPTKTIFRRNNSTPFEWTLSETFSRGFDILTNCYISHETCLRMNIIWCYETCVGEWIRPTAGSFIRRKIWILQTCTLRECERIKFWIIYGTDCYFEWLCWSLNSTETPAIHTTDSVEI